MISRILTLTLCALACVIPCDSFAPSSVVVVTGAAGRVGRIVVEKLLEDPSTKVIAMTRDGKDEDDVLPTSLNLEILKYDPSLLPHPCTLIHAADDDCDEFTATFPKFFTLRGRVRLLSRRLFRRSSSASSPAPSIVLLSSAGVTRTSWSKSKAKKLEGCADIPIIRLNPGNILNKKAAAENRLRVSNVPYTIVRPTGLKDAETWPAGRPILSQGDFAVGRTTPEDLADVLIAASTSPAATSKTFEMLTLTGYPPLRDLTRPLEACVKDGLPVKDESYKLLQQLLPGEEQDATKLEMGRSYEAVDSGVVAAREGGAAPTARELEVARRAVKS